MHNILIVTPTLCYGGTEVFIANFVKAFKQNKIDILYYAEENEHMVAQLRDYCDVYKLPYYRKHFFAFLKHIFRFYQNKSYDTVYVHANHTTTVIYTLPIWFNRRVKLLYHSHSSSGNNRILKYIFGIVVNCRTDVRFACSEAAVKYMYGRLGAKIIKNSIDLQKYRFLPEVREKMRMQYRIGDKDYVIGNVARFSYVKNQKFLIKVFCEVKKILPNTRLLLIGDGEDRKDVMKMAESLGVLDDIFFINQTNTVEEFYQMMDVFVLPSLFEGLPFTGVEAQASGTKCLFSNGVGKAVNLTPLVSYLSLEVGEEVWAKKLCEMLRIGCNKEDYIDLLENKGFGLEQLKEEYKGYIL